MSDSQPLISLDVHNQRRTAQFQQWDRPTPNGIACPLCGNELMDSTPGMTLASYPPQYNVHCPSCNYHGYRH